MKNGSIHLSRVLKTVSKLALIDSRSLKNLSRDAATVVRVMLPDSSMKRPMKVIDAGDNRSSPQILNQSETIAVLPPSRFTSATIVLSNPSGLLTVSSSKPSGLKPIFTATAQKEKRMKMLSLEISVSWLDTEDETTPESEKLCSYKSFDLTHLQSLNR